MRCCHDWKLGGQKEKPVEGERKRFLPQAFTVELGFVWLLTYGSSINVQSQKMKHKWAGVTGEYNAAGGGCSSSVTP